MKKLAIAAALLAVAFAPAVRAEDDGAKEEHAALTKAYQAARAAYYEALRAGKEAEAPEATFLPRFLAAAERYAETEDAVPFLVSTVSIGRGTRGDFATQAIETLLADHLSSPALTGLAFPLMYGGPGLPDELVTRTVDRVALDSPVPAVKATYFYVRAFRTNRNALATEAERDAAVVNLRMALALAPESPYAPRIEGLIFEMTRLQIGMVAPEIEGEDLDGNPMKLSDYRGKVLVLDFWGDW